jgi:hypothetical protein
VARPVLAVLVLLVLAAACAGGDPDSAPTTTTAPPATTLPTTTVAPTTTTPPTTTTIVAFAPATEQAFLDGCVAGAGEPACRCLLEQAEIELDEPRFLELADAYAAGGELPDELRGLAARCATG